MHGASCVGGILGGYNVKYIFDLYWFNSGGQRALNLSPSDYQDEPPGGWENWTAAHNVDFMVREIGRGESFMLVGDLATLRGQARNAGRPKTRCMVGAEVLLLRSAGYGIGYPPPGANANYVLRFDAPKNPAVDASLVADAKLYLNSKSQAALFWTPQRKETFRNVIGA